MALPTVEDEGPVLAMFTSAAADTITVRVAVLFVETGSVLPEGTAAVAVTVPAFEPAVTPDASVPTTLNDAVPAFATVAVDVHVNVPSTHVHPVGGVIEVSVKFAGW